MQSKRALAAEMHKLRHSFVYTQCARVNTIVLARPLIAIGAEAIPFNQVRPKMPCCAANAIISITDRKIINRRSYRNYRHKNSVLTANGMDSCAACFRN